MRKEKRSIHLLVLFCAAVLLCLSGGKLEAQAAEITASGTCGSNLTWTLDDQGTLTISGTGNMTYYLSSTSIPWYNSSSSILTVVIKEGVTSIGQYAFRGCGNLSSVTIPDSVTSIGYSAFEGCSSLTSISIPDSVASIGSSAFTGCTSLTGIWVDPNNTAYSSDSDGVLFNKEKTKLIWVPGAIKGAYNVPDSLTSIGYSAFEGRSSLTSVTIPDSITSIGYSAFEGCSSLTNITIPDSVTSIGYSAFEGCSSLTSITIPNSVTRINEYTFYNCSSLSSVTIGDSVTIIDYWAFRNCSSLTSITIPDSVTSIDRGAFYGCSSLESITIPFVGFSRTTASDTYQYPFGYIFGTSSYAGGTATKQYYHGSSASATTSDTYYIPSSLKSVTVTGGYIPYGAFYNCSNLTSITIGNGVTGIGDDAFYSCSSLTDVYISDIAAWCNIAFTDYGSNPLFYAKTLYLNGEEVTDLVIPDSVTSIGDYAFYKCSSLNSVTIGDSVTSIGEYAFCDCSSLTSVAIGDSVTSIGNSAFYLCSGLTSVAIGDSVATIDEYTFYCCRRLTSITIPDSVTSIGKNAFEHCSSLTQITIPDSVTSIGDSAFYKCSSLTSITIPDGVTSIGDYVFYNCDGLTSVAIGDSVATIGKDAFYYCYNLTSITIPDSVTSIGNSAFYLCSSLTDVYISDIAAWCNIAFTDYGSNPLFYAKTLYLNGEEVTDLVIPDSVTSIGDYAFCKYSSLNSVTIGDSVTSIGDYAFYKCSSLNSVTIGDSVTSIGDGAFRECSSLSSVTIGDSVTSIGDSAFRECSSLSSVIVGDSVTSIGDYVFYNCYRLTTIAIPDGVTNIGDYVFYSCYNLASIAIPDGVTSIGDYVFYNCDGLTSIIIPDSVISIGEYAFSCCERLTSVTVGDSVTSIGEYAFELLGGSAAFEFCSSLTEIIFKGDAPSMNYFVFMEASATAYYPAGNDTWTEAVTQYYGGAITWVAYEPELDSGVEQWNLVLDDDLCVNFHLMLSDTDQVQITVGDKVADYSASELELTEDGCYKVSVHMAAAQMTEAIVLTVGDGDALTYTVAEYANTVLADESYSEYHALVKEMLHYGAMAQLHFGYNAENLANAGITGVAAEDVPETAGEVTAAGKIDGVAFYGASLVYRDKIAVRCYFTGDVTGCSFTANGNTYTPVEKDGMHYVEIGDIPPQDLDQQLTLTVTDADGNELSVTYGPMDYMVRMNAKGSDTLKALMKALYNYHLAAKALRTTV